MVISTSLSLSYSYFRKHLNRYVFLLLSLSIGFAVITVISLLSTGMRSTLFERARSHYGGDLLIISYDKDHGNRMHMSRPDLIREALDESGIVSDLVQERINSYKDGILYFNGQGVLQKNILGVNWENEDFSSLDIVAGSAGLFSEPGSLMISETTARELGCRVGDDIVLQGSTLTGQKNTVTLVLKAIFADQSFFGAYKSYVSLKTLSSLMQYGPGEISSIGLYLNQGTLTIDELQRFHSLLSAKLDTAPLLQNKEELTYQLDRVKWKGERTFIIPLEIYISQVDELIVAMDLLSYFLYLMVAVIILVSVTVSYQLILRDRQSEIATLRAMGMRKADLVSILLLEALWLFLLGLIMGVFLSLPGFLILSVLDTSRIPGFELFLQQGRLKPHFSISAVTLNVGLLGIILLPAALVPSFKAAHRKMTAGLS